MNKIYLIIQREYLSRVRKKSFIIMTVLGPVLMAALILLPALIVTMGDNTEKIVAVINPTKQFDSVLKDSKSVKYLNLGNTKLEEAKKAFKQSNYYAILEIPDSVADNGDVKMYSEKQPSLEVKMFISNQIEKELEREKLKRKGIDENILNAIKSNVNIKTIKWTKEGAEKQTSTEIAMAVGFIAAIMIYMFVFIYGAQVMRGVIEEKTSRVIEILISSVKPFQLMMGKIIGIGMVVMTQFLLWIVLTLAIVTVAKTALMPNQSETVKQSMTQNVIQSATHQQQPALPDNMIGEIFTSLGNMNIPLIIFCFIFYFLGGYLLYSSLFAAIGAAVDNETDTQQFMLPITIPLILAFVMAQAIIQNPEGQLSFWFSIIPLTSPIIMMVRIPFEVPVWQLILSMALLVLTFIGTTWMAGKIYRTGILMYGKKVNYQELWKWLRYHN